MPSPDIKPHPILHSFQTVVGMLALTIVLALGTPAFAKPGPQPTTSHHNVGQYPFTDEDGHVIDTGIDDPTPTTAADTQPYIPPYSVILFFGAGWLTMMALLFLSVSETRRLQRARDARRPPPTHHP